MHHTHGPEGREKEKQKEKEKESRKLMIEGRNEKTISLYAFALVVCRRESDGKFLLVQEYGDLGYVLYRFTFTCVCFVSLCLLFSYNSVLSLNPLSKIILSVVACVLLSVLVGYFVSIDFHLILLIELLMTTREWILGYRMPM